MTDDRPGQGVDRGENGAEENYYHASNITVNGIRKVDMYHFDISMQVDCAGNPLWSAAAELKLDSPPIPPASGVIGSSEKGPEEDRGDLCATVFKDLSYLIMLGDVLAMPN
ncbi:hypothetical protein PCH_Pc22g08920 [Penicillium rubens Wisconsin 54-1255]|uniref:Uncharacterized protein n=1 Tax=Penicillium rubens (strain ATCC 28089 / DSM 1075 / NRRL 1951 / Wisconsin 54-1255) TaxID=500485 RepID=B6HT51_PENRW|nr:hypothetical protein PCH_Pc22g08920 [Penicillium rubens Wisconsin 54-1255]